MSALRTALLLLAGATAAIPALAQQHVWVPTQQQPVRGTSPAPPPQPAPPPPPPARHEPHYPGGIRYSPSVQPELPNCTVTFSGAVSGTYGCHYVQATWRAAEGISVVRIASNPDGQVLNHPTLEVGVGFRGPPAASGTHSQRDAVQGATLWLRYNGAVWAAAAGGPGLPQGGYLLSLARASDAGEAGYGRVYTIGGRLSADLPAYSGGASGAVHVEVRF